MVQELLGCRAATTCIGLGTYQQERVRISKLTYRLPAYFQTDVQCLTAGAAGQTDSRCPPLEVSRFGGSFGFSSRNIQIRSGEELKQIVLHDSPGWLA